MGRLAATEPVAATFSRPLAAAYLMAYANYGYDVEARQFWGSLKLDGSPVPGPRVTADYAQFEPRGHIDVWQPYLARYEHPLDTAQLYAFAYQITHHAEILKAAERWAGSIPREAAWKMPGTDGMPRTAHPTAPTPDLHGQTFSFFLHMEQLTGQHEQELVPPVNYPPCQTRDAPRHPPPALAPGHWTIEPRSFFLPSPALSIHYSLSMYACSQIPLQ